MVVVHCRRDCHPQHDCRRDCSSGGTRLTWVTVARSTQPGDRHRVGLPWVAVSGLRVWVWSGGLQPGWRPWVAQCTNSGGHRMWVVGTLVGCHGTQFRCQWRPQCSVIEHLAASQMVCRLQEPSHPEGLLKERIRLWSYKNLSIYGCERNT